MNQLVRSSNPSGLARPLGKIGSPLIEPAHSAIPLGVCNPRVLGDPELMDLTRKLESFTAPWLREKAISDGAFKSAAAFDEAFIEFKRYVLLCRLYPGPKAMTSREVDLIWHQFILFTAQYHKFCMAFLGRYLHHSPVTSHTPAPKDSPENLWAAYKETFGVLHRLWKRKGDKPRVSDCEGCSDCASCSSDCGGHGCYA